ncbi:MAG: diacylglycerol kinase [Treponema sp.]|nr:diacylglycerol kinase [Treponema sp.]
MIVVNPVAGGFSISSKWESHIRTLTRYKEKAEANPVRPIHKNIIINLTEGKGSAFEITSSFLIRMEKEPDPFYLIISAGGDGTHGEVMGAVYKAPAGVRSNLAVLRLPMGTGNDGADSANLGDALDLLLKPSHIEFAPAVQLITSPNGPTSWKGPFLAFNILSVGIDAYVTHQTNTMKGKFPGDSYKFWIEMATLFYERKYKVDYTNVRALDAKNNEVISFREKLLLLAMGASGNRTYGSQQKIMPDSRNACAVKQTSFFRKLSLKNQLASGKHINSPETIAFNAHHIEFSCKHPILAQMDGETVLLQPGDFPAKMELTTPAIPLLKMD